MFAGFAEQWLTVIIKIAPAFSSVLGAREFLEIFLRNIQGKYEKSYRQKNIFVFTP